MSVLLPSCKRPKSVLIMKQRNNTFVETDSTPTRSRTSSLEDDDAQVMEDDTSIQLTMDMPGVRYQDLEVTVQCNTLSIRGHRCVFGKEDRRIMKRHKLHRRFVIDTSVVDVSQAHAHIKGGKLVLYAPKTTNNRCVAASTTKTIQRPHVVVDEEFETPGALSMQQQQQQ